MEHFGDKKRFFREHVAEILPVVRTDPVLHDYVETFIEEGSERVGEGTRDLDEAVIERFRTRIYRFEKAKDAYADNAKNVVLEASDPLTYLTSRALIDRLRGDGCCKSITLITDNVASEEYQTLFETDAHYGQFSEIKQDEIIPKEEGSTLRMLMEESLTNQWDIVICSIETANSPTMMLLFGSKSNYGVEKLYLMADGWNGIGQRPELFENEAHMDAVDAIFCIDDVAKKILLQQLPERYAKKIIVTGGALLDSLDTEHALQHAKEGRQKLGMNPKDIGILFLGDVADDYKTLGISVGSDLNVKTLNQAVLGCLETAQNRPDQQFFVMVRPHPRDASSMSLLTYSLPPGAGANIHLVDASRERVSMAEAAYASNVVVSIASTENFIAPARGRQSVFLGFGGEGQGGEILSRTFGDTYEEVLRDGIGFHVVHSTEQLTAILDSTESGTPHTPVSKGASADTILRYIFNQHER